MITERTHVTFLAVINGYGIDWAGKEGGYSWSFMVPKKKKYWIMDDSDFFKCIHLVVCICVCFPLKKMEHTILHHPCPLISRDQVSSYRGSILSAEAPCGDNLEQLEDVR